MEAGGFLYLVNPIQHNNMNSEHNNESKPIIFLQGIRLYLRPLGEEGDAERCCRWINDPETRKFLKSNTPISLPAEQKWVDESTSRKDNIALAIVTLDGVHIGNIGVHKINMVSGTASTGTMIGEKEYLGKGYGTEAKMILLNYLFNTLNLRKICSTAYAFNKRSIAYSHKCGYKVEGIRRKHIFREGKYQDVVELAVFKEDWLPLWKKYNSKRK